MGKWYDLRYNMTFDIICPDWLSWFYVMIHCHDLMIRRILWTFFISYSLFHDTHCGTCPWFFVYDSHCGTLPMILCSLRDFAHDSLFIAGLCPWFFLYCGTLPMILSRATRLHHYIFNVLYFIRGKECNFAVCNTDNFWIRNIMASYCSFLPFIHWRRVFYSREL